MTETRDIITAITATPVLVFTDATMADALFQQIEAEIAAHVPDLSTGVGRKAIASLAYKVAQTKTAIDGAGAALNEDANKRIAAVNAERRRFKAKLQEMQDRARKPLDDWEADEERRLKAAREMIAAVQTAGTVIFGDTAASVRRRLTELGTLAAIEEQFGDMLPVWRAALETAKRSLAAGYERLVKEEADQRELDKLRKEQAARDRAQQMAAYIKEIRGGTMGGQPQPFGILIYELDTKISGGNPFEDTELEAARVEAIAYLTSQMEKQGEERARHKAQQEADARAAEKVAAAEREATALRKAEADRLAEEKRLADEQAARDRDTAHRKDVMDKAAEALVTMSGMAKATAVRTIQIIAAGSVPGVSIRF